ncbi:MAG: methyltransferase domain-containing protein [Nocardioidaceae bacterium]
MVVSARGPGALVWDALRQVLAPGAGGEPGAFLHVVDLGGGTGGLAVAVAELGHRVTVVDPSPNALAALERRAADAGVTALVRGVIGDAVTVADLVGHAVADLVVCHGVLEVVDEPAQALRAVAAITREGGHLTVLATQQSGAVFARVLGGHLDEAAAMLRDGLDRAPRRFSRQQLESLVGAAGFTVAEVRGVRVFTDHVASRVVDAQPGGAERLRELEAAVCTHADFLPLATQLHLLARKL